MGKIVYQANKYLWRAYYMLESILGAEDRSMNKTDKIHCPHGAYILLQWSDNKQQMLKLPGR